MPTTNSSRQYFPCLIKLNSKHIALHLLLALIMSQFCNIALAQNTVREAMVHDDDVLPQYFIPEDQPMSIPVDADSIAANFERQQLLIADSLWKPDFDPYFANYDPTPAKSMWYSMLFPGGGQLYNRKYWKLPIIVGGYLGLVYGYQWNQKYYRTYANAYRDLVLNTPNPSYLDFLPPRYDVEGRRAYLEKTFKRKRNFYRTYRDYCLVGMLGVYMVAMVDAYVDASLYHFDVSTDLDANNRPALMVSCTIDF